MNTKGKNRMDLAGLRARLAQKNGPRFWRSLQELAETEEYKEFLGNEFPRDPARESANSNDLARRDVLKLMAASAALAGLSGCTKLPAQKIVPYVRQPEEFIPGKPLFFATSMPQSGGAIGLIVESHMGRPTKIEGNPEHPASLGATNAFAQASVLTLYDPDRSQVVIHEGRISDWPALSTAIANARDEFGPTQGAGFRILTEAITSPTLAAQIQALLKQFPQAKWHQYEPCGSDAAREGAKLAFGEYVNTIYRFDQAEVILSLDSDFLCAGPASVRQARDFSRRRCVEGPESSMNRLYAVEATPSNTGALADHRLPLRASGIEGYTRAIAARLGVETAKGVMTPASVPQVWIDAVAKDLEKHPGASIVIAGDEQPPAVHALAHAMNAALGNVGRTVIYAAPIEANPMNGLESLQELVRDMRSGQVQWLVILDANPVFSAPADLDFARELLKVKFRAHLGLYDDETAELCHWHVPAAHYLESWSDARAYDGTVGIIQPLIAPLYDGHTAHEVIALLAGDPNRNPHDIVRNYWMSQRPEKGKAFEDFWEKTLHDGLMAGAALPPAKPKLNLTADKLGDRREGPSEFEIVFRPDPTIGDGRWANNGWLQELPKPLTKLTWDNAAMVSPVTAQKLGLSNEDVVQLSLNGRTLRAPVWIMPGHADDCVTLHLGYGRRRVGHVGAGIGVNTYALRTSAAPRIAGGLKIEKTGDRYPLATTQHHHMIDAAGHKEDEETREADKRDLVRVATLEEFRRNPKFAVHEEEEKTRGLSLYPDYKYEGYAWGMAIDLNACTGCGACVVACQAENNIAVVGKAEVMNGRAMHWIRLDTYFRGDLDNPESYYEPVLCMHCENAPCEVVCPVAATLHTPEGLNAMVYNRCVGTRYCSNNCPYKVRRFNFRLYSDWTTPSLYALRNPNVSVRSRGVMEKCTYCVQRINAAKIESEKQNRKVRDGEIVTACQGACPAEAIVFGNINDPDSRVTRLKAQERNYGLLTELNTRPRTTYLARLRNPNPEMPV